MILRSFIAIEMPTSVQDAIDRSTTVLKKELGKPLVRWVPPHNVHLTLKFLGDVSQSNLELLAQALKVEAREHTVFSLSVGGLGAFPNPRRARVIWIGIEAPEALQALQHAIEAVSARLGYTPENRPFSPHLTIGRVNQNASAGELQHLRSALEATHIGALGAATVDAVHIFKSDLLPSGAVYTHINTAPFGK
jgi:2'-5' RNA ligase